MKTIYLLCGVSGSGKTWVCEQLQEQCPGKFHYIPHDKHYDKIVDVINREETMGKPIITECPFGERLMRDQLQAHKHTVKPYFVIEPPVVVHRRYMNREGKPLPKNAFTRASTIVQRADEWKAPKGTSSEVLELLKGEWV